MPTSCRAGDDSCDDVQIIGADERRPLVGGAGGSVNIGGKIGRIGGEQLAVGVVQARELDRRLLAQRSQSSVAVLASLNSTAAVVLEPGSWPAWKARGPWRRGSSTRC